MLGTPKSVICLPEVSWARCEIATRDSLLQLCESIPIFYLFIALARSVL